MKSTFTRWISLVAAVMMATLSACDMTNQSQIQPGPIPTNPVQGLNVGSVIKQGEDTTQEQAVQRVFSVYNCNNTLIREEDFQEVQSISQAVHWQFQGQVGVSFLLRPFGLPLDLSGLLSVTYSNDSTQLASYGLNQQLNVPANSVTDYTLEGTSVWWKGQIPISYNNEQDYINFQYEAFQQFSKVIKIEIHPERCANPSDQGSGGQPTAVPSTPQPPPPSALTPPPPIQPNGPISQPPSPPRHRPTPTPEKGGRGRHGLSETLGLMVMYASWVVDNTILT